MEKQFFGSHGVASPKTNVGRFRTAYATSGLLLTLLMLPAAVHAQDYTYATNNGTITITKYTGSGGAVTIPSTITGLPVTSIGQAVFPARTSPTSVTIPNSVTNIGVRICEYVHLNPVRAKWLTPEQLPGISQAADAALAVAARGAVAERDEPRSVKKQSPAMRRVNGFFDLFSFVGAR